MNREIDRSPSLPTPDPADYRGHRAEDDPWWQESSLFTWSDPRRGLGGEYRIAFHPARGVANVYTWSIVGGEMVDRRLVRDVPLPGTDVLDSSVGGITFRTVEPGLKYEVSAELGELTAELTWTGFMEPAVMSLRHGNVALASGHYNSLGRATGVVRYREGEFEVSGDGFHDHSWGRRKEQLPGSRWLVAVFDPEFYIMAMPILGPDRTTTMLGYVCEGGRLRRLVGDVEMGYTMRDDWVTPAACDARLFDEDGRGYRVLGRTIGPSSSQPFPQGKFVTHAQAEFECGGRLGRGLLESTAPRYLSPGELAEFDLPADHFLNAPFAD